MRQAITIALCVVLLPAATSGHFRSEVPDAGFSERGHSKVEFLPVVPDHELGELDTHSQVISEPTSPVTSPVTSRSTTPITAFDHVEQPPPQQSQPQQPRRCHEWEPLLALAHPSWDVVRMSQIMWRESRCLPGAQSPTSDTGLLQINQVNHDYLTTHLGVTIDQDSLTDPLLNIAAAGVLCDYWDRNQSTNCYQPWVATDLGAQAESEKNR
jgi:hypothetical protein